jgi:hypothetical protein
MHKQLEVGILTTSEDLSKLKKERTT